MNFIVKLYDIFEKNSCSNCLAYIFFDHLKIFDHYGIWCSDIFAAFKIPFWIGHCHLRIEGHALELTLRVP